MSNPVLIQIVDEHDRNTGAATIYEARQKQLWHRISRVAVLDKNDNILLQKRSKQMEIFPNCWEISASGHVDEGESYEQAALREAKEEIGLIDVQLEEVEFYQSTEYAGRVMKRFNKTFRVIVEEGREFKQDEAEVSKVVWFTRAKIQKLLKSSPDKLSDGLKHYLKRHYL